MASGRDRQSGPPERNESIRRSIVSLLREGPLSARQLSARAGIPEKEVYGHLPHIRKSVSRLMGRLVVTPAECTRCAFVFRKRDRPARPGRCPVCRGESITEPLFSIEEG